MKVRNPFKGRIQKSFLERNQLLIGIFAIVFVLGGSGFALLLSGGFFANTYEVMASFADAAGVKGGDEVLVAGLEAGDISGVEIKDGAVEVTMDVSADVEMPADVQAEIIVETLMGKKSVQLYGGTDDSGQLEEGDSIPLERTDTPVELLDLQDTSVPLLEESDAESFESFMVSLSEITSGKEEQVTQLLRGFADTTKAIETKSNELARLIESFKILSTAFADKDQTIVSLIDNFDIVLANLSERRADIETLLQATDSASHEVANLVSRNRSDLDPTLRQLHVALDTINQHQLDLAGILSYLEDSVQGYQSIGYSQGTPNRWANVFVQSLGGLGIDEFFGPCG
ncbi:MAG: MCE family protein, partial [Actinomycetota bacterium]